MHNQYRNQIRKNTYVGYSHYMRACCKKTVTTFANNIIDYVIISLTLRGFLK